MFFGNFFGLFRQSSVWFGCFENTETNRKECFLFRETNRKTTETDLVSVCFGSNQKKNLIVSRIP
jgi:hypothetical protein